MNVLIAAGYQAAKSGNFIPSILELGLQLRQQGDTVIFLFPRSENALRQGSWREWLEENGFTVYLIDRHAPQAQQLSELRQILEKHRIHILHSHFNIYKKLLLRYRDQLKVKVLVHDHFAFSHEESIAKQKLRNGIKSILFRMQKVALVAVNEQISRSYWAAKHWYLPNGLSLQRNVKQSMTREQCRAMLGLQEHEQVCMFLGWSLHVKGLDVALKAMEQCRQQLPNAVFCIVGVGCPPTQEALQYIRSHTTIDPTAPWIRYIASTEDMFAYHRAADVYLSASRTEGFSYGLLEAISQNTPVVVSDIEGTQWAKVYDHAFFYPVEAPSACAEALVKALQVGRTPSNYEAVTESYSIANWCRQMVQIYHSL